MKVLRDPLVVFLLIGGAIFFLHSVARPSEADNTASPYQIEITPQIEAVLKAGWESRWNRPPTEEEWDQEIDAYIEEEILYREGIRLGLERGDSIIRRRLAEKVLFLNSDLAEVSTIPETQLAEFFAENSERYRTEATVGFLQIFFSTAERGAQARSDAETMIERLRSEKTTIDEALGLGDPTRLSSRFATSSLSLIGRQFGASFAKALLQLPPEQWSGPVQSEFGYHAVFVKERTQASLPELDSVRVRVTNDFRYETQQARNEQTLAELRQKYEVVSSRSPTTSEAP
ncbi:MAG: peptidyl-prolyl cis-trans isomerase [Verrucomicrobiales bacterium]